MFQLWSNNVNVGTRWDIADARHDASYMSKMWSCNVAIWACDAEGDFFVEMAQFGGNNA